MFKINGIFKTFFLFFFFSSAFSKEKECYHIIARCKPKKNAKTISVMVGMKSHKSSKKSDHAKEIAAQKEWRVVLDKSKNELNKIIEKEKKKKKRTIAEDAFLNTANKTVKQYDLDHCYPDINEERPEENFDFLKKQCGSLDNIVAILPLNNFGDIDFLAAKNQEIDTISDYLKKQVDDNIALKDFSSPQLNQSVYGENSIPFMPEDEDEALYAEHKVGEGGDREAIKKNDRADSSAEVLDNDKKNSFSSNEVKGSLKSYNPPYSPEPDDFYGDEDTLMSRNGMPANPTYGGPDELEQDDQFIPENPGT